MLTINDDHDGFLHVFADGQLSTGDYVDFVTSFEWFMGGQSSPILMLVELGSNFGGWGLDALFRDENFDLDVQRAIRGIAIVGDARWEEWGTGASYAALADDIRFFETKPPAIAWLGGLAAGAPHAKQ